MLEKLEYMLALAREKHFGRAAESCGVAQATFSQGIQVLEGMLNVPLVKRSSRFQGFTTEGDLVLVWARRLVGDVRAMRQEIAGLQRGVGAQIRIAVIPSAMPTMASLTAPFQLRHPAVRLTLLSRSSDELLTLLDQRDIDAGVTYISNEPLSNVEIVPLYREEYLLLATADSPVARDGQVTWARLSTLPLCLLTPELQQRRIIDAALRQAGVEVSPTVETDSLSALMSYVLTGNWVSVVSRSMMRTIEVSGSLRALAIVEPELSHTIGLIVSKRFPIQPIIASLMREVPSTLA